jgi:hypothetical protein
MRLHPVLPLKSGEAKLYRVLAWRPRVSFILFEPIVGPTADLFFPVAVLGLQLSLELLIVTFDLEQVIIGEVGPLFFELTFELSPPPFELIRIHPRAPFFSSRLALVV